MSERCFGISYFFTPTPPANDVAKKGEIVYNPTVVYKESSGAIQEVKCEQGFRINSQDIVTDYMILSGKKNLYTEMQKRSRDAQERIISEYICAIILRMTREFRDDNLTFLIRDEFKTEKIVGRLGYLGLPMERLHIMFVSCNLTAFMGNYIERYAVPLRSDLTLLFSEKYRGKILGPYPDDDGITMLRTYYCSFELEDTYPLKINLFCQMLNKEDFNKEKKHIRDVFMDSKELEAFPISGGKGTENTRLPNVLAECEEYVNSIAANEL